MSIKSGLLELATPIDDLFIPLLEQLGFHLVEKRGYRELWLTASRLYANILLCSFHHIHPFLFECYEKVFSWLALFHV